MTSSTQMTTLCYSVNRLNPKPAHQMLQFLLFIMNIAYHVV